MIIRRDDPDIVPLCIMPDCELSRSEKYAQTGWCDKHVRQAQKRGWNIRDNGTAVRDGVSITASGMVKITGAPNRRTSDLLAERISVTDLDAEELAMGMCKNDDGTFPAKVPHVIPRALHMEMKKQLFSKAQVALEIRLIDAVDTMGQLMSSPEIESAVRLNAAKYILERVMGKTADVVEIKQDKPWEILLDRIDRQERPAG